MYSSRLIASNSSNIIRGQGLFVCMLFVRALSARLTLAAKKRDGQLRCDFYQREYGPHSRLTVYVTEHEMLKPRHHTYSLFLFREPRACRSFSHDQSIEKAETTKLHRPMSAYQKWQKKSNIY